MSVKQLNFQITNNLYVTLLILDIILIVFLLYIESY